jgi:hypothetical protein
VSFLKVEGKKIGLAAMRQVRTGFCLAYSIKIQQSSLNRLSQADKRNYIFIEKFSNFLNSLIMC